MERTPQYFIIEDNSGKSDSVSIARLKPASKCATNDELPSLEQTSSGHPAEDKSHTAPSDAVPRPDEVASETTEEEQESVTHSRAGRRIKFKTNNDYHYY